MSVPALPSELATLHPRTPVLIAGPTGCGKSALAMRIAQEQGGVVINADAIQVYKNFRHLTARPSLQDEASVPHRLYGHISHTHPYSVGQWLREITPLFESIERPIVVGGTGLYFQALTKGLAEIPAITPAVVAQSEQLLNEFGHRALADQLDATTQARIDLNNPRRVQRAWQVLHSTGRNLASWQDLPHCPPIVALADTVPIVFNVGRDWLNARIRRRFNQMLADGALQEVQDLLPHWSPNLPCAKAIGAPQLVAYLRNEIPLDTAIDLATIATKQFAKRQRTWFRSRMADWHHYLPDAAILPGD
jgi:tRNA dimethylallyltransferase